MKEILVYYPPSDPAPTAGTWSLAVMGLLMFTIATLLIRRRRVAVV